MVASFALVAEGSQCGNGGEEGGLVQLVGLEPGVEARAQGGVGHDGVGADNARYVEGL